MASCPPPAAAAFSSSQAKFGSSCYFPIRTQAQPQPRQALLLPPLARKIPNSLVALKKSNSSSRCHAVAAEVEGLNIADDVTQVTPQAPVLIVLFPLQLLWITIYRYKERTD